MRLPHRPIAATLVGLLSVALAVALGPQLLASPSSASATHAGRIVTARLAYGSANGRQLWMDEYAPAPRPTLLPPILLVHGGGWAHGSPAGSAGLARQLAAAGFAVFDVEYSLDSAGHPGLREQPAEVAAAANWINGHAHSLAVEPDDLGVLGSSAGGNLVARVVLGGVAPALRAVVAWSGPMDFADFAPLVERACDDGLCPSHWLATDLLDYVGCRPSVCPASWRVASPIANTRRGAPPMLLFNSTLGPTERDAVLREPAAQRGNSVRLVVLPGTRHAGAYGSSALGPTISFLRSHLRA